MNKLTTEQKMLLCKQTLMSLDVLKELIENFDTFAGYVNKKLKASKKQDEKDNLILHWFQFYVAVRDEARFVKFGKANRRYLYGTYKGPVKKLYDKDSETYLCNFETCASLMKVGIFLIFYSTFRIFIIFPKHRTQEIGNLEHSKNNAKDC